MKKFLLVFAAFAALTPLSAVSPAWAQDYEENIPPPLSKGHISMGIGAYDAFDDETAADFRLEYRQHEHMIIPNLKPFVAAELTSDKSFWAGGGFVYDWNIADRYYVTPGIGVGLYAQGDSELDLGHTIEFRPQIEVAYELDSQDRVGIAFSHLSNKGMDDHNPGTEVVNLYYHYGF